MRLVVYWPSPLFMGAAARPLVIIDGMNMGNPANAFVENLMPTHTAFVADVPRESVRVWWIQNSQQGEEKDKTIELHATAGRLRYLRWAMRATYGFLHEVDEKRAVEELADVGFSGYVKLAVLPTS